MMLALTAGGPQDAYSAAGYQHFPLRTFLTPLEQTARLCDMAFAPPYVLYGSLKAPGHGDIVETHVEGYRALIEALRDDAFDFAAAAAMDVIAADTLPIRQPHAQREG